MQNSVKQSLKQFAVDLSQQKTVIGTIPNSLSQIQLSSEEDTWPTLRLPKNQTIAPSHGPQINKIRNR
jgi:hypothetical protein